MLKNKIYILVVDDENDICKMVSEILNDEGYQWFHGEYKVTTTAIREVWGLTEHQWRRFMRWCYKGWPS